MSGEAPSQEPGTPEARGQALLQRVAAGEPVEGLALDGASLKCAQLQGAQLRRAQLSGADLQGICLQGADLSGADLSGALLNGAQLQGADLSGADLSGAQLRGVDFRLILGTPRAQPIHLPEAILPKREPLRADLSGADLSGAVLSGADLQGACLQQIRGARADLSGADLLGAQLAGADLTGAGLQRANLQRANLQRAVLSGADLSGAVLSGAQLQHAILQRVDAAHAVLLGADLSGADLSGAQLLGASLSGADLRDADLSEVSGLVLDGNRLGGARLAWSAADPWSVLCRSYTPLRLLVSAGLVLVLLSPVILEAVLWGGIGKLQQHHLAVAGARLGSLAATLSGGAVALDEVRVEARGVLAVVAEELGSSDRLRAQGRARVAPQLQQAQQRAEGLHLQLSAAERGWGELGERAREALLSVPVATSPAEQRALVRADRALLASVDQGAHALAATVAALDGLQASLGASGEALSGGRRGVQESIERADVYLSALEASSEALASAARALGPDAPERLAEAGWREQGIGPRVLEADARWLWTWISASLLAWGVGRGWMTVRIAALEREALRSGRAPLRSDYLWLHPLHLGLVGLGWLAVALGLYQLTSWVASATAWGVPGG